MQMLGKFNFIFILAIATIVQAQVITTFDTDSLENWRSEGDGSYYLELNTGNPVNCMRVDDDATGDLNIAFAPVKFLGDWSNADTTDSIYTDIFVSLISGTRTPSLWVFRISGPGGSARGPLVTVELDQWNHIAIALDSSFWQISSGTWTGILDYVNHLEVRVEYINGDEFVRLDNIGLSFSPVVKSLTPPIVTEFENRSFEGWTFIESGGTSIAESGGNPGGYCRISDGTGITQAIAPPKFLGDWSQLNGLASIQLDLKISNFSGPLYLSDFLIKISGPGGQAIIPMDSTILNAANQWETFSYLISDNEWMMESGDWTSLLNNVTEVRLITEYISGTEIVSLDNIRITTDPSAIIIDKDIIIKQNANYKLEQNYPNPFNPLTQIAFTLPKEEYIILEVYNILGQSKQILLNKKMPAGHHQVEFNGEKLPSGVYFYRIKAENFHQVRKMVLIE
jgi:hypothetical protein